jgi:phenylpropionate dioxygenase-like ring-hydroxylating dioxygenase large terminal subunit
MFLGLKQDFKENCAVPIAQLNNNWLVVNHCNYFYLLSNVCPHQNSRISECQTSELTCPYHGMQFDLLGSGIGNKFVLTKNSCYNNGNMLFDRDVPYNFPVPTDHFELVEHRQDKVSASVEVIMDVFLDIDHIPIAHKNVYDRVGITDIKQLIYKTFDGGSIQFVPAQTNSHMIAEHQKLKFGACWMALYPGTMIEWQPGALFVTVATANGVQVYKYCDTRYPISSWKINEDVWELAWSQDKSLSKNIVEIGQNNLNQLQQHHRIYYAV